MAAPTSTASVAHSMKANSAMSGMKANSVQASMVEVATRSTTPKVTNLAIKAVPGSTASTGRLRPSRNQAVAR